MRGTEQAEEKERSENESRKAMVGVREARVGDKDDKEE